MKPSSLVMKPNSLEHILWTCVVIEQRKSGKSDFHLQYHHVGNKQSSHSIRCFFFVSTSLIFLKDSTCEVRIRSLVCFRLYAPSRHCHPFFRLLASAFRNDVPPDERDQNQEEKQERPQFLGLAIAEVPKIEVFMADQPTPPGHVPTTRNKALLRAY